MIKIANNLQQLVKKQADDLEPVSRVYDSIVNAAPFITGLSGAAGGGLLGAGIGGLVEYLRDKKKKDYLKALVIGAGIGAGTGGLVGGGAGYLAASRAKNMKNVVLDAAKQKSQLASQESEQLRPAHEAEPNFVQPTETPPGLWSLGMLSALRSGGDMPDNTIQGRIGD